ncbi:MAG: SIMPL domain-containing protein [Dehalococcoidia bacterium]|nr:SIMPL domain-containing protein [Dehalococcoidia bacterium]
MKKINPVILLALVLIPIILLGACADSRVVVQESKAQSQPQSWDGSQPSRTFTVTGEAEIRVVPDEVILTLGVETLDKDLNTARNQNDERIKRVLAGAAELGIAPKDVQTDYMSISSQYDTFTTEPVPGYKCQEQEFKGFSVRKNVVITLKDIAKFDDLYTFVMTEGANYVQGIQFQTTEMQKYRIEARALAVKAAREKAAALAEGLDQKLGKAQTISEGSSGWWPGSSYYGGPGISNVVQNVAGEGYQSLDGTIAPGQISVTSRVTVVFELGT